MGADIFGEILMCTAFKCK